MLCEGLLEWERDEYTDFGLAIFSNEKLIFPSYNLFIAGRLLF